MRKPRRVHQNLVSIWRAHLFPALRIAPVWRKNAFLRHHRAASLAAARRGERMAKQDGETSAATWAFPAVKRQRRVAKLAAAIGNDALIASISTSLQRGSGDMPSMAAAGITPHVCASSSYQTAVGVAELAWRRSGYQRRLGVSNIIGWTCLKNTRAITEVKLNGVTAAVLHLLSRTFCWRLSS